MDGRCRLVDDGEALDDLVHGLALFGLSPSARLRVLNVALDEVEKTDAEMSQDRDYPALNADVTVSRSLRDSGSGRKTPLLSMCWTDGRRRSRGGADRGGSRDRAGSLDRHFEPLGDCGAVERPFGAELYGDPADSLQTWAAIGVRKSGFSFISLSLILSSQTHVNRGLRKGHVRDSAFRVGDPCRAWAR